MIRIGTSIVGRLSQRILQNSRFFSFFFSHILRREKNVASNSAILESDLKDCAGSQKELDEISSGITVYRVFLQRAYCAKKKALQLANGKIVVFFSFFFFSLISHSHLQPRSSALLNQLQLFFWALFFSLDFLNSTRVTL